MDKPIIRHVKNQHMEYEIHDLPGNALPIHESYGLRVFNPQRREDWPPSRPGNPRSFQFYGLSHLIRGKGWYWSQGKVEFFQEGQGVLSTPGFPQNYGGNETIYSEDAICFIGPIADHLFRSGIIRNGIITIGPVRRLLPILDLVNNPADTSQIKANILMQNLLIDLYFENMRKESSDNRSRIESLLETINANPKRWWTVSEMAEIFNLSEVQFRRVFQADTGIPPKQYTDRHKIQKAAERLCSSRVSICEIAQEFGYVDPYHFSRRFKAILGSSPQDYRKTFTT
jgi:AraC-like DNA-binding protein